MNTHISQIITFKKEPDNLIATIDFLGSLIKIAHFHTLYIQHLQLIRPSFSTLFLSYSRHTSEKKNNAKQTFH